MGRLLHNGIQYAEIHYGIDYRIVQLPERVQSASASLTCSSHDGNWDAWGAFTGVSPTDLRSPQANTCWRAGQNDATPWLKVDLGDTFILDKVRLIVFSDYLDDWVGDINIQGSNDGTTFADILASGDSSVEITAKLQELTTIDLSVSGSWRYVKIVGLDPFTVYYQPSCFFDEVYIFAKEPTIPFYYPLLYSLNKSQGAVWVNTNIDMTDIDKLFFSYSSNGASSYGRQIDKSDIAVYTGGADVYTMIFPADLIGKAFNIRIYNSVLYVSFNGIGASTDIVTAYDISANWFIID